LSENNLKQIAYAVFFVLRRRSGIIELLLARRAEGQYMGGTWQLITGGIEEKETAWQAALRELREETGLIPVEFYRLSAVNAFYRADVDAICHGIPFCAIVDPAAVVKLDHENTHFEWCSLESAEAKLMWSADRQTLAEVRQEILEDGPTKPYLRLPLHESRR
jgi:dATP pyrophosphohydrolase